MSPPSATGNVAVSATTMPAKSIDEPSTKGIHLEEMSFGPNALSGLFPVFCHPNHFLC